uniref:Uncharacterized protein n=1 Tax=Anopheles dirus TaxID=7168 RepID=A0A182NWT5_9DIPT
MADEDRLNDLVNQAVSSEYPHIYGAVNLNRLREVLFFLAASRRSQPEQPEHVIPWNEQIEQDAIVVRKLSEEFEKCDSLQNVLDTASSSAPEAQDDELECVVDIMGIRSPPLKDERPFSELSVNEILLEIEKIGEKVNEINERVFRMETKSLQLECQCIHNVKVMGD